MAAAVTSAAFVACFLSSAMSEYRYQGLAFWTLILAAPVMFAVGGRRGLLGRFVLGVGWMVAVSVVTLVALLAVIALAVVL